MKRFLGCFFSSKDTKDKFQALPSSLGGANPDFSGKKASRVLAKSQKVKTQSRSSGHTVYYLALLSSFYFLSIFNKSSQINFFRDCPVMTFTSFIFFNTFIGP